MNRQSLLDLLGTISLNLIIQVFSVGEILLVFIKGGRDKFAPISSLSLSYAMTGVQ